MKRLTRILVPFLFALLFLAACGGGGGDDATDTTTPGPDAVNATDQQAPADTVTPGEDSVTPPADTVEPLPDLPQQELPPATGDKELGEECVIDGQCVSDLCLATKAFSGCTLPCATHADCQAYGLVCIPIRENVKACAPPPPVQVQCATHEACLYPTLCVAEFGWCDLPECTWDGDCPEGQECAPGARKCQPVVCNSTYECEEPLEFCLDSTCGPPECTSRDDCAEDEICSYLQGICTKGTPCNEEGACNMYNQQCIDGLCEPDFCADKECPADRPECHPKTGLCGAACTALGDCPDGWGCDTGVGICYENAPPIAVPGLAAAGPDPLAANVAVGTTVTLDGSASYDPEGLSLTWLWMVTAVPPGENAINTGTIFCQQATCSLGPLQFGHYQVALRVVDEAGAVSAQSLFAVYAQ